MALQIGEEQALPRLREILANKDGEAGALIAAARVVLGMMPQQKEIVHRVEGGDARLFMDACDEELREVLPAGEVEGFEQRVLARYAKKKGL